MEIRRRRHGRLIACAFASVLLLLAPLASAQTSRPAQAVVGVGMTVDDMDRSLAFFTKVLDFKPASDVTIEKPRSRVVQLKLGDETLELTDYLDEGGREIPRDSRSNDRWFQHAAIVTTDMDVAYTRLLEHKVRAASVAPQRLPDWNKNAAGIRAFYFLDPDNHVLEVIQFPPGKGDPRWQGAKELFAGLDHTAIVVGDTDKSLAFYRDGLGMKIVGGSDNYGIEQERLNNVPGAHLRITTLRAASGPGVELLEYLSPRDGRPYPSDAKPNDIFHWQTMMASPAVGQATLLRDPDHHAVQLVPPADPVVADFVLPPPDGKHFVALHFLLKTECPYCMKHTREYLRRAGEVSNVRHFFLKPDEPTEILAWAAKTGLPTIYHDPDARWAHHFKIPGTYKFHGQTTNYPALVVLDPTGKEVFRYVGKSNTDRYSFDGFATKMAELAKSSPTTKPAAAQ
jgi:catechol 2,3-dioxygenase-like lactoylglutathione lyase family enzyme